MSAKAITGGSSNMTKDFQVSNKLGIHARPAAMFVKTANRFSCDIFVEKDGEKVNGKSIMGLMMLAAGPGSKLTVHATRPRRLPGAGRNGNAHQPQVRRGVTDPPAYGCR